MVDEAGMEAIIERVQSKFHEIDIFRTNVVYFFENDPDLTGLPPIVHSVKSRMKDLRHLHEKIQRKSSTENPITPENIFDRITSTINSDVVHAETYNRRVDSTIAGVRVIHLYQAQFSQIHRAITQQLESGDWTLYEPPTAYTWDPESQDFFAGHGLSVEVKESLYTSIHYVVQTRPDSTTFCEIQVRTLFEEIWGEIDHRINYPEPIDNEVCRDQIGVLARLVGAGSRLADSTFRAYANEKTDNRHSN
jgi:ppGpp synthetase/RelA/SpoT-type nucleotidyltranferase